MKARSRFMRVFGVTVLFCLSILLVIPPVAFGQSYTLEKVVVLSRHNIRAPLADRDSALGRITPHSWFPWSVPAGDLSPRGGALETLMGSYFAQWLDMEGLFPLRGEISPGELRFYANSYQRTIATARYFAAGMFPMLDVPIEHHYSINQRDPVFWPPLPKDHAAFLEKTAMEIGAMGGSRVLEARAAKGCALAEGVLDFRDSRIARQEGISTFPTDDLQVVVNEGYYTIKGVISPLMMASDALVLQYYEETDGQKAAFGHILSREDWKEIARIKALGVDALYDLPTVATILANPILNTMKEELSLPQRKFTFLCGHDVNLAEVTTALGAGDYVLPDTIEEKTPTGAKLVIEKRKGEDGEEYARLSMIYASTDALRQRALLTMEHPPCIFPLKLKGLQSNEDGYYSFAQVQQRMDEAIKKGDEFLR